MKQQNKKGFTIVELVIVIAVIAILAAVLIPTFSGIIQKANLSADVQTCKNMNTTLSAEGVFEGQIDVAKAKKYLKSGGFENNLTPKSSGYHYYWYESNNTVYLVKDDGTNFDVYFPEDEGNAIKTAYTADASKFHRLDLEFMGYLTFTANTAGSTVTPGFASGTWQYSTDGINWNDGANDGAITITLTSIGDKVMLKGSNCTTNDRRHFSMTGSISASGSVTSLTDGYGIDENVILSEGCYAAMFVNCTSLTTAPALPAITLTENCYGAMFSGCTSLTTAPDLPATTLAESSYHSMFVECESLTTAPVISATTLARECCYAMFLGCTSLTTAPALPATTLAESCYYSMFEGCESLTTAPALPATALAENCYSQMFSGCTSLIAAPALPATALAKSCYYLMFSQCTSLTTAPELPATTLADLCYFRMFQNCTNLTAAPALPATTLKKECYLGMFCSCAALTTVPSLRATVLEYNCYYEMFQYCTSLYVSDTQTAEAQYAWVIPGNGTFSNNTPYDQHDMFPECPGARESENLSGANGESHTYYTQNKPVG